MVPNIILIFIKNKCVNSEKTQRHTRQTGQTDRFFFIAQGRQIDPFSQDPSGHAWVSNKRNYKKALYTARAISWQKQVGMIHDWEEARKLYVLEVCEVRSWLPKTDDNNKTNKNDADTLS